MNNSGGCPKGPRGEEGFPGAAVVEISHRLLVAVRWFQCKEDHHSEVCVRIQPIVAEAMELGRGRMEKLLDGIRSDGWSVAVHNDYVQGGEGWTFWGFSRGTEWVRGEGGTDVDALENVVADIATRVPEPARSSPRSPQPPARGDDFAKIDAFEHLPLLVRHPSEPWSRVECKCGHKGAWLKNDWQCGPCPRAQASAKFYHVITVTGWGTLYGLGTVTEAEAWRAHKANWEKGVARKRLATAEEVQDNAFDDLSTLEDLSGTINIKSRKRDE